MQLRNDAVAAGSVYGTAVHGSRFTYFPTTTFA